MSGVTFFSLSAGPTALGATAADGSTASSGSADASVRADFSGLLAIFAAGLAGPDAPASTTMGSWAADAPVADGEGSEATETQAEGDAESEGTGDRKGGPDFRADMAAPSARLAGEAPEGVARGEVAREVVRTKSASRVLRDAAGEGEPRRGVKGGAPLPVAWTRDLGLSISVEHVAPSAVVGAADVVETHLATRTDPGPGPRIMTGSPEAESVEADAWGAGRGPTDVEGMDAGPRPAVAQAVEAPEAEPRQEVDEASAAPDTGTSGPAGVHAREVPNASASSADAGTTMAAAEAATASSATRPALDPVAAVEAVSDDPRLGRLHPEMKNKVLRVVERMAEAGHSVEILEGYRSPERQRELFAQGRTAPGPVVTWTTASRHTEGLAVDIRVDGSWDAPEGYARLQQVAREEGLVTLGNRDPGHLELRLDEMGDASSRARRDDGERSPERREQGRARTARVASVADVAGVARTARVARPGHTPSSTPTRAPESFRIPDEPTPVAEPDLGNVRVTLETAPDGRVASATPTLQTPSSPAPAPAVAPVGSPLAADPMSGVERVMDIQDAVNALNPTRVSVRLDGTAGPVDQVRVSLADRALDAWMDVRDTGSADQMRSGIDELYRALEGRGFEPGTLGVSATGPREGMLDAALASRGDMAASVLRSFIDSVAATGNARQTGGDTPQQQRDTSDGRPQHDGSHRSRREDTRRNQK